WAYAPWAAPVTYRWGWVGRHWTLVYASYFVPYPVYRGAPQVLADGLIASALEDAYEDRVDAGSAGEDHGSGAITPDVKQAIADEVQRQIDLERSEVEAGAQNSVPDPYSSGIPAILDDGKAHVFVVSSSFFVTTGGQECAVTPGDV